MSTFDAEVARILDETIATLKREGADIVQVELPSSASSRRPVSSFRYRSGRLPQALDDRTPRDYGRRSDAVAERARDFRRVHLEAMRWRGRLAAHDAAVAGVDAMIAPAAPWRAPTIAESDVGTARRRSGDQRLTRFTRPINYSACRRWRYPRLHAGRLPVACSWSAFVR